MRSGGGVGGADGEGEPGALAVAAVGPARQGEQAIAEAGPGRGLGGGGREREAGEQARGRRGGGRVDVIVSADSDNTLLFLSQANGHGKFFSEGQRIPLARAPYGFGGPVMATDFNRDGDADILLLTAYGYSCFYEHSFITAGYAEGKVLGCELRRPHPQRADRPRPGS